MGLEPGEHAGHAMFAGLAVETGVVEASSTAA